MILDKTYDLFVGTNETVRYGLHQVSVRRAGFHSSCNFRIDLPGENGSARRTHLFGIEIFRRVQVMVLTRRGGGYSLWYHLSIEGI